jgi:hypothetical protein
MAHEGAWTAIRQDGLMSAKALIEAYAVPPAEREALGSFRRPQSVPLVHPSRPGAVLRDQKPMSDKALRKCLRDDLDPRDWYALLNSHTFFWLSRNRIWSLLGARAYRDVSQTVLTVDTRSLVAAHRRRIWLSPMNSGSTIYNPLPRGRGTFQRIEEFPFLERGKTRRPETNVVELLVEESVRDIADHVLAVHECRKNKIVCSIWRSPNADANDHP